MIAAIYARKSTQQDDVPDDQKSVARQIDGARAFITAKGWTLDERRIYSDDGVSGALWANRAEFQRMMRDAEAGAFDAVVFFDLDRFGRNARQTMMALNALIDLGIAIWDYSTGQQVDLESFEGETMTFMKARFAQQSRDQNRKHTTVALWHKAKQGLVAGGRPFGYDNHRIAKGQVEHRVNNAEAAVVREIFARFADGEGLRTIALALNQVGALSPRAQQGRPNGWSSTSVREVLGRPIYRGIVEYGKTKVCYGRELGPHRGEREQGQIATPADSWFRSEAWADRLRIVDPDLAARVDARRESWRQRVVASRAKGRAPQNAGGKYLLTGGLLVCPTCGGHFEALKTPWSPATPAVYVCSTRRRKPSICTNRLRLSVPATDDAVLAMVEGEALGGRFIEELLLLVDTTPDPTAQLQADRERLRTEVANLVSSIAAGVPAGTVATAIRTRESEIAKLDVELRRPRPVTPNRDALKAALEQRASEWRATLRAEPKVARLLLRRLVGPITLWDESETEVEWDAGLTHALLDGLVPVQVVTSPTGTDREWIAKFEGFSPARRAA